MKKRSVKKLQLSSETLLHLQPGQVRGVVGGTLTYEGSCENSFCEVCTALCTAVEQ